MTMFLTPYAEYVWAAYVICLGALLATVIATLSAWHKAKQALKLHDKTVQTSETNL